MPVPIPENIVRFQIVYKIKGTDEICVNTLNTQLTPSGTFSWTGVDWQALTQECADTFLSKLTSHCGRSSAP